MKEGRADLRQIDLCDEPSLEERQVLVGGEYFVAIRVAPLHDPRRTRDGLGHRHPAPPVEENRVGEPEVVLRLRKEEVDERVLPLSEDDLARFAEAPVPVVGLAKL